MYNSGCPSSKLRNKATSQNPDWKGSKIFRPHLTIVADRFQCAWCRTHSPVDRALWLDASQSDPLMPRLLASTAANRGRRTAMARMRSLTNEIGQ
jgi:hypothetical protein